MFGAILDRCPTLEEAVSDADSSVDHWRAMEYGTDCSAQRKPLPGSCDAGDAAIPVSAETFQSILALGMSKCIANVKRCKNILS